MFSYWTATLDLLEQHLKARSISYLRIDGNVTNTARLRILEDFRDKDAPVLLMTVGTGAVGSATFHQTFPQVFRLKLLITRLNLTVANYVHIVEPQWNPAVEEQAIARALRMGQSRPVTVVRYVVKNSIEEVSRTCPHA